MYLCPICRQGAVYTPFSDVDRRLLCGNCGNFRITGSAIQLLENCWGDFDPAMLSAIVKRQPRGADGLVQVDEYNVDGLISAAREVPKPVCPTCGR